MAIQSKAVLVYNKRDDFYKIYPSITQAMKEIGVGLRSVLYGKTKWYGDFTVKYFEDATEDEMLLAVPVSGTKRGVEIYSVVYDRPIRRFSSIEEARRYIEAYYWLDIDPANINACASGKRKHAGVIKVNGSSFKLKWRWIPLEISSTLSVYDYDYAPAEYRLGDYKQSTRRHHDEKPWRN